MFLHRLIHDSVMPKEFWDDGCKQFSKKLWKPSNTNVVRVTDQDFCWNCDHPDISFKYFNPINKVDVDIKFLPVPLVNNSGEKNKLFFVKFNLEFKRFNKELVRLKLHNSKVTAYIDHINKICADVKDMSPARKHKHLPWFAAYAGACSDPRERAVGWAPRVIAILT